MHSRAHDCHYKFNDLCIKRDSCNIRMQGKSLVSISFQTFDYDKTKLGQDLFWHEIVFCFWQRILLKWYTLVDKNESFVEQEQQLLLTFKSFNNENMTEIQLKWKYNVCES